LLTDGLFYNIFLYDSIYDIFIDLMYFCMILYFKLRILIFEARYLFIKLML